MNNLLLASVFIFAGTFAWADLLDFTGAQSIDAKSGISVKESVTIRVGGQPVSLKVVGAGLRKKELNFILKPSVYNGILFTDKNQSTDLIQPNQSVAELARQNDNFAFKMDFVLTALSAKNADLIKAFNEGFDANGVDKSKPAIVRFLNAVSGLGDYRSGDSMNFAITKLANGTVSVFMARNSAPANEVKEINSRDDSSDDTSFTEEILSLWLGKSSDKLVVEMQKQIKLGVPNQNH